MQLYQIYGRRTPEDVHSILKSFNSSYIILEDSICLARPKDNCRTTDIVDLDNGIVSDEISLLIKAKQKELITKQKGTFN